MSSNSDDSHPDKERAPGSEIYGPGKTFFDDVAMDNLMDAFLELTAAVWTYRDRSLILEKVLQDLLSKDNNVDLNELIEQYRPDAKDKAERQREREKLINTVFSAFARRPK